VLSFQVSLCQCQPAYYDRSAYHASIATTSAKKFHAYLAAEIGPKAADLATVAPGQQGERTDLETSGNDCPKFDGPSDRKAKNLRAILRAPEVVQDLYREGLLPQTVAAKLGPKSPTPEDHGIIRDSPPALPRAI
jgi:hypothetical protein